jgi:hypothetical protein
MWPPALVLTIATDFAAVRANAYLIAREKEADSQMSTKLLESAVFWSSARLCITVVTLALSVIAYSANPR